MLIEFGHIALIAAFLVAFLQGVAPFVGLALAERNLVAVARPAAILQFALLTVAFAILMHAYIVSDFSVQNVAANSHSTKPLIYKISGTWGNHEGSLLLWVWILALFGAAIAIMGTMMPESFRARVIAVQGLIGLGFLAFTIFTSNPFARLIPAPVDGNGLNPILQDPGLAIHPPMLYLGYVGLSTAYSFAMAALLEGRVDATWARWAKPWILAAWSALTIGIALGSWWAYYELGWGGWWFWDPVENASFMPWLAGTALLHSTIVVEKRDTLKTWTLFLAILAFSLSLLGTFLVRSGVLTSVHAFATDPERGVFILALLVVAVGGSFLLYAWRAPSLEAHGIFAPVSREGSLVLNNLLIATATATVFLGTLYPLFLEILGGAKISVGPPFFNATFIPLMIPLAIAVPIGSQLAWKRGNLKRALDNLKLSFTAAVLATLGCLFLIDRSSAFAAFGIGLGIWVIVGSLDELRLRIGLFKHGLLKAAQRLIGLPRSALAMTAAHIGLGVMILGITASSSLQTERILVMKAGDTIDLAGYRVTYQGISEIEGPNYIAQRGEFEIDGVGPLHSEKRYFPVEQMPTTEAGIDTNIWRDLYVVLGEDVNGGQTVRLYHNPLVVWIWAGAGIMALGALISLTDRRHRVGAPRRNPAKAAVPA